MLFRSGMPIEIVQKMLGHESVDTTMIYADVSKDELAECCQKAIALRMVWQVYNAVNIPVVGLGGIMNATDAIEFLLCGATALQIGTANFIDPAVTVKVIDGINEHLDRQGCKDVKEIIGGLRV